MKVDRIERSDDKVCDVIVEIGRPEPDPVVQQRLLEADVVTGAGFRREIGIGDGQERPSHRSPN